MRKIATAVAAVLGLFLYFVLPKLACAVGRFLIAEKTVQTIWFFSWFGVLAMVGALGYRHRRIFPFNVGYAGWGLALNVVNMVLMIGCAMIVPFYVNLKSNWDAVAAYGALVGFIVGAIHWRYWDLTYTKVERSMFPPERGEEPILPDDPSL